MNFFAELKRRNVIRAGLAYTLFSWLLLQVVDFALDVIGSPNWIIQVLVVLAVSGLPAVMVFAWVFELTPEGIKRESEVRREDSIRHKTGRRLDSVMLVTLVLLVVFVVSDRFIPDPVSSAGDTPSGAAAQAEAGASHTGPATAESPAAQVPRSIAVLPFVNMSADQDNEFFSDGVSEEILNVLASIPNLKVAARTSAFKYKGSKLSIAEIAGELGVTHVLEGSVRKAGNQVRITAQLIEAEDGFHLWSDNYDRELTNIFAIQDEIASSIANVLEVELLGGEKAYTTAKDLSPETYEKFLRARFLMRRRNQEAMAEAARLGREVTSEAPDFPRGLAQLAEALMQLLDDDPSLEGEIRALTQRALTLDPNLAAAHMINGNFAMSDGNPLQAMRQLQNAIELDATEPRPYHWLGILYANLGYLERAREALERAVDLDPEHANAHGYLGLVLSLLGNLEAAEIHSREQARLGNPFGLVRQIYLVAMSGDPVRARSLLERLPRTEDETDPERLALFLDALGDTSRLGAYLDHLERVDSIAWHTSTELMILGQYQRGLEQFDIDDYPRMAWGDAWAEARALPYFQEQVRNSRMPEVWDVLGPPEDCRKVADEYDCAPEPAP